MRDDDDTFLPCFALSFLLCCASAFVLGQLQPLEVPCGDRRDGDLEVQPVRQLLELAVDIVQPARVGVARWGDLLLLSFQPSILSTSIQKARWAGVRMRKFCDDTD